MNIDEIERQIEAKREEISELVKMKKDLEIGVLENFLKGKLLKFGDDINVPIELENKYIYVPEQYPYGVFLSKNNFFDTTDKQVQQYELVITCMSFAASSTTYLEDNFLNFDLRKQISIPYNRETTVSKIMESAIEVEKDELIKFINTSFKLLLKDIKEMKMIKN